MTHLDCNIFEINLGDWSDDGHGKTKEYRVAVPAEFTLEMIAANYEKNCKKYGITLEHLCEDYEDNRVSLEVIQAMVKDGLDAYLLNGYDLEEDYDARIITEDYFYITCHMFFHGMPDNFTWKEVKTQGILLGGYGAVELAGGYGLFH